MTAERSDTGRWIDALRQQNVNLNGRCRLLRDDE